MGGATVKKKLYYAVDRRDHGCVFTSLPVRNEKFGIWEGNIETCFSEVVASMEADGLIALPNNKYGDEPVAITLSLGL